MIETRGKLLVMEGIGGSGKDTQAELLKNYLVSRGVEVVETREHTRDTPPGKLIERIIKREDDQIDPLALQILYISDRRNHCEQVIKPNLVAGKTVLCNRYYPTTVAYSPDAYRQSILRFNQEVTVRPDLVFIIDTDPEVAAKRVKKRGDPDIFDKAKRLSRCRQGYEWYRDNGGDQVAWIDGNGSKEEVAELIVREIVRRKIVG